MVSTRFQVEAPAYTPLPYGLMSVVQLPDEQDTHWRSGILFQPDSFAIAGVTNDAATGTPPTKEPTAGIVTMGADPMTPYAMLECSPVGHWEDFVARTTAALTNGEARAVEREFWTGAHGTHPHLAANLQVQDTQDGSIVQTAATDLTPVGGAVNATEGLVLLEQALATCYGGVGVIHVTRATIVQMRADGFLITAVGKTLQTPSGHLIAVGAGYPGTGPDGSTPTAGEIWMYATGAIALRRTDIEIPADRAHSLNRATNTLDVIAERTYVVAWDSLCHFAVRVLTHGLAEGV